MIRRFDELISEKSSKHQIKEQYNDFNEKIANEITNTMEYINVCNNKNQFGISELKTEIESYDLFVVDAIKTKFDQEAQRIEQMSAKISEKESILGMMMVA